MKNKDHFWSTYLDGLKENCRKKFISEVFNVSVDEILWVLRRGVRNYVSLPSSSCRRIHFQRWLKANTRKRSLYRPTSDLQIGSTIISHGGWLSMIYLGIIKVHEKKRASERERETLKSNAKEEIIRMREHENYRPWIINIFYP